MQKQLLQNNYVHKGCKLTAVKKSCRRINQSGSAVQSHPGSGQPGVSQTGIYCVLTRCLSSNSTRSPAIAEGPRDAGVPVEIW